MSNTTNATTNPATTDNGDIPQHLLTSSQYITTHNPTTHLATFHPSSTGPIVYTPLDPSSLPHPTVYVSYIHSTPLPTTLSDSTDISVHASRNHSTTIGLPNGIIAQIMLYRPGMDCPLHRTITLDYGVILEGSLEIELDGGEKKIMKRGDVIVQRGTMHSFRNVGDEWAKAFFVGVAVEKVVVEGKEMVEDLSGFQK